MTAWTKAQAIAEIAGGIGIVFTLFYSVWSFRTTLRDSYYAELDRVYFDLQQVEIDAVQLRVVAVTQRRAEAPHRIEQGEDDADAPRYFGDRLGFRPRRHDFGSGRKDCHGGCSSQTHSSRTGSDTACNISAIRGSSDEQWYTSR